MELISYYKPAKTLQGVISIPHSGEIIKDEFLPYLTDDASLLAEDIDFKVPDLIHIDHLLDAGYAIIISHLHRFCVDLNRSPKEAVLNWRENTMGAPVVIKEPDEVFIKSALSNYHAPYYQRLNELIAKLRASSKPPLLFIDLHSMPSRPTAYHLKKNSAQSLVRKDICLSNLDGDSTTYDFCEMLKNNFLKESLTVSINDPYKGGYITQSMNFPDLNNIQIEINRASYMDEQKKELLPKKAGALREKLTSILLQTLHLDQL